MTTFLAILLGLVLGLFMGGAAGLGIGLLWIEIVRPSNFEGAASFGVVFGFAPAGAIAGAIGLGCLFGVLARRRVRRKHLQARGLS